MRCLLISLMLMGCPRSPVTTAPPLPDVAAICALLEIKEKAAIEVGVRELGLTPLSVGLMYGPMVEVKLPRPLPRNRADSAWGAGEQNLQQHPNDLLSFAHSPAAAAKCIVFSEGDETTVERILVRLERGFWSADDERMVVTLDSDLFLRTRGLGAGETVRLVSELRPSAVSALEAGAIVVYDEAKVRARSPPIAR